MATIPSEDTLAVGGKIQASWANSDIRDAINFLASGMPRVSVSNSTAHSHTSGTALLLTWDTEAYDTDTMHSTVTNTSRLVATTAGTYTVNARIAFASNATGIRYLDLRKNAAGAVASGTRIAFDANTAVGSSTVTVVNVAIDVVLAAADYLEVFGFQNSGGALSTDVSAGQTLFQMRMVQTT